MTEASNILSTTAPARLPSVTHSMQVVAQHHGVSVFRQIYQMVRLRYGPGKLTPFEYYRYHVYRRGLTWEERRAFVGDAQATVLSHRLTAPERAASHTVLDDKPVLLALAEASGLGTTRTQALYSQHRRIGPWRQLETEDALANFLLNDAHYPLFGKPCAGRNTTGGVQIAGLDDNGHLRISNGETGPHARALAAEIAQKFPAGYLLQDCALMAKNLRPLAPEALGPLRLITIYDGGDMPSLLYTYLRLPVSGTEVGPGKSAQRFFAALDAETCTIRQAFDRTGGTTRKVEIQPATGAILTGFPVPQLTDAIALARDAHMLLPQIGIIGWDIALTDRGPLIIEGNGNPSVADHQLMTGTGILCPEYAPRFAAARARAEAHSAALRAARKDWELGAIRDVVALERGRYKT